MKPSIAVRAAWLVPPLHWEKPGANFGFLLLAVFAVYPFAGCSADDTEEGSSPAAPQTERSTLVPGAGTSSGSGGALRCPNPQPNATDEYVEFYEQVQTLYCERQWECCQPEERPLAGDSLEECLADVGKIIPDTSFDDEDSMRCGRIVFLKDKAAACLEQLRTGSCADLRTLPNCVEDRNGPKTRRLFFEATSPPGEACESDSLDCAGGYCDTGMALSGRGKCAPWKPEGASCYGDQECSGNLCEGGTTCGSISIEDAFCSRF
jgi:hypothetical protein